MKKRFKTNTRDFKSLLELRDGKVVLQKNADIDTFRKIHARGPQPFDFDFLQKFDADAAIGRNAGVREIRKAHQSPLRANISFDARELSKAFDARRLRKVNFPPQSSNAVSGGAVADTGASNRWKDQVFDKPNAARVGSQTVTDVSRSPNIKAVLDALKQDMSKPKRMAV